MFEIPVIRDTYYLWKFFLLLTVGIVTFFSLSGLTEKEEGDLAKFVYRCAFWVSLGILLTLIAYLLDWKITIETPG